MAYFFGEFAGLKQATSLGDGNSIQLTMYNAYATNTSSTIAYNFYYSDVKGNLYKEGPKYLSLTPQNTITGFTPGDLFFFGGRAVEFNGNVSSLIQISPTLYMYPSSLLSADISETSLSIPLLDVANFPASGTILIGAEFIQYASISGSNLIVTALANRGIHNTKVRPHKMDGNDGSSTFHNSITWTGNRQGASIYIFGELENYDLTIPCESRFEFPNYSQNSNGYKQVTANNNIQDLSSSDSYNEGFRPYDYAGAHRADPVQLVEGVCTGSYIGGEYGCIDPKTGDMTVVRGMSLQERMLQREEMLLSVTGVDYILLKRMNTGIVCQCYTSQQEFPDDRCPFCFGTGKVLGYSQFFNPRQSNGRIRIRPSPFDDASKLTEQGFDSQITKDGWTLTVPTIYQRDVLIEMDQSNNEEFRYEVLSVNRDKTYLSLQGSQKVKMQRITKTDQIYKIKVFHDTSRMPTWIDTGPGTTAGIPPHTHQIRRNEGPTLGFEQLTQISQGHNHEVKFVNGVLTILPTLNHTHTLSF